MNDSEQNFEELRQLLRLKRYEVPPPGFFNRFSGNVIAALAEQRSEETMVQLDVQASWLSRFLGIFDSRPGLMGGLAASLTLLLVFGVVLADRSDKDAQTAFDNDSPATSQAAPVLASATLVPDLASTADSSSGGITVSTNPFASLQPASPLMGQPDSLFQNVNYSMSGSSVH